MRLGITGAHRVGKSTLARELARIYNLPFLTSRASDVAQRHDFNMATANRLDVGIAMQMEQLERMIDQIDDARLAPGNAGFVTDRTPIDAAAYMLADATASAGNEIARETAVRYVEKAMALTAKHFDLVILVPPAIEFEVSPGKPPFNQAYQEHHHMLCRGMLFDDEIDIKVGMIQRTNTVRHERIAAACEFVESHFASAQHA